MPRRREKNRRPSAGDLDDPRGFVALARRYLEWMRVKNYSERTVENREHYLGDFMAWCEVRGLTRPAEVTKLVLERFQRHLYFRRKRDGMPLSFRSQYSHLVPVRTFFKWLSKQNHILANPAADLELPKVRRRLPKDVLTAGEAEAVMNAADVTDPLGARDRAILETLYSTGMRRTELIGLHLYDLDRERGTVMIREGKGKKDRMVPIGERAMAWIEKYVSDVRPTLVVPPDEGVLFLSNRGESFVRDHLTHLVKGYVEASGIGKKGACHLFRHTMATLMLEGGADIRFIQEMLGHAELSTTQIYTQVSIRKLKEIHTATHPAARLERRSRALPDLPEPKPREEAS